MRTTFTGTSLIILGAALSFILVWIFSVDPTLHLTISLLLIISGAIVGFVIEWVVDERLRKKRAETPGSQEETPGVVPPPQAQEVESLEETVRQRENELQHLNEQISSTADQLKTLQTQFDLYRKYHPDQLTRIKGIGPVYQRKLREIGINSFAQLAGADPQQLREALGVKQWQRVDIEFWVRQADDWANGPNYD